MKKILITSTIATLFIIPSMVLAEGAGKEIPLAGLKATSTPAKEAPKTHYSEVKGNMSDLNDIAGIGLSSNDQNKNQQQNQNENNNQNQNAEQQGDGSIQTKEVETVEAVPDVTLTECLSLTREGTKWESILSGFQSDPSSIPQYWIGELTQKANEYALSQTGEASEPTQYESAKNQYIAERGAIVGRCIGYSYVLATREVYEFQGKIKKSFDEKLVCTNYGFHTMDYEACASMINAYDMTAVAQVGLTTFQTMDFQAKTNRLAQNLYDNPSDPTGALKAQKSSLKKQEEIANQQAAFFTAKAATLLAMQQRMPTREDLVESCQVAFENAGGAAAITQQLAAIPGAEGAFGDLSNLCLNAVNSQVHFLPNLEARDAAKAIMAGDAFQAAAKVAQGALLHKNAKRVNTAISNVEAFDPSTEVMQPGELKPNCALNPNAPGCKLDTNDKTDIGFADNGFDIGGGWGGNNNIGPGVDITDDNWTDGAIKGDSSSKGGTSIGTPIADANNGSGFEVAPPAPGTVKTKEGGNGGGGAGGGGGVSAVGLPSGGGGGYGGEGGMMAGGDTPSKTKMGYGGGSGVKYGNAPVGRKVASKAKNKNPFDALFGKKKGGNNNGVLNFRDPASNQIGDKNGKSIFEMISHRYKVSQEKKRLIEYDVVEK